MRHKFEIRVRKMSPIDGKKHMLKTFHWKCNPKIIHEFASREVNRRRECLQKHDFLINIWVQVSKVSTSRSMSFIISNRRTDWRSPRCTACSEGVFSPRFTATGPCDTHWFTKQKPWCQNGWVKTKLCHANKLSAFPRGNAQTNYTHKETNVRSLLWRRSAITMVND